MLQRRRRTQAVESNTKSTGTTGQAASGAGPVDSGNAKPLKFPAAKLGEILVVEEVITAGELERALEYKRSHGGFLGQALMDLEILDQATLTTFLVKQCKIPHLRLDDYNIDPAMSAIAPAELCEQHGILPIDKMGKILTVAMVDPLDREAMDAISAAAPELQIKAIHCDWRDFDRAFKSLFPHARPAAEVETPEFDDFGLSSSPMFTSRRNDKPKAETTPEPALTGSSGESLGESLIRSGEVHIDEPAQAAAAQMASAQVQPQVVSEGAEQLAALLDGVAALLERLDAERQAAAPSAGDSVFSVARVGADDALPFHYTFETFIGVGENAEAAAIARQFIAAESGAGEMLIIGGAPAAGKTHLAVGVARAIQAATKANVGYISCERWATAGTASEETGVPPTNLPYAALVVDDFHRLYGQVEAQNAVADQLSRLHDAGGRSIITFTAAPEALGGFDPQLLSRLGGGIRIQLEAPRGTTLSAVGKQYVRRKGLDISDEIIAIVAENAPGDLRKVMGALLQIAATAELRDSTPTVDVAKSVLDKLNHGG